MRAACLQYAPVFGRKRLNRDRAWKLLGNAKPDLLVLPELFATGYVFTSREEAAELAEEIPGGETSRALADLARSTGGAVVAGIAERDGDRLFNSAALFDPSGFRGVYRKAHLFFEEKLWFAPGDRGFPVWDFSWGRLGMLICYDWRFPEAWRALALAGADVAAHPSNLVHRDCPRVMPARALENRIFTLTADRTGEDRRAGRDELAFPGQTLAVDPAGRVLFQANPGEERLLETEIDPAVARDKRLNPHNQILEDRRTDLYGPAAR